MGGTLFFWAPSESNWKSMVFMLWCLTLHLHLKRDHCTAGRAVQNPSITPTMHLHVIGKMKDCAAFCGMA